MSLGALRRDSSTLARNLTLATGAAQRASQRAESLFLGLPDTLRVGVRLIFDSLAGATVACEAARANCELRAENAEARVRGDSTQLLRLVLLTDTLEAAWHTELQRNRPGFLGLRDLYRAKKEIGAIGVIILTVKAVSNLLHH